LLNSIGSQIVEGCSDYFTFIIFNRQIWLNRLVHDHHISYWKLKEKKNSMTVYATELAPGAHSQAISSWSDKKDQGQRDQELFGNKCKNSSPLLFLLHIIKLGHCISSVAAWHIIKHTCEGTYCAKCQNFFISKKVPTWWWVPKVHITI
jgi:hypothetical protein